MTQQWTEEMLHKKSPQEITTLLYEAAINNLETALSAIHAQDFLEANVRLQKTNDILHRLGAGINYEAGIVADQLDALYNFMADKLIEANYRKAPEAVQEVLGILRTISEAWKTAMEKKQDMQAPSLKQKALAYEQNAFYDRD